MDEHRCCSPQSDRESAEELPDSVLSKRSANAGSKGGMVRLDDGVFQMGAEDAEVWVADGEGPVREVSLDPFWIDQTCVTNEAFAEFVEDSSYETEAERFGWSFVFLNQIPKAHRKKAQVITVQGTPWWARIDKADWRKPGGPGTNIKKLGAHPVVHVSWSDAVAFANWAGKRLPSEAEWEYAARGGLEQEIYPWGSELTPKGKYHCNIWQGNFPQEDTGEDGYAGTAPAKAFRANGHGLYQSVGNVWEWTADWFSPSWHNTADMKNPIGPESGPGRVIKGGSFLCHESYCNRYRNSARSQNTPDSSTCHTGFRCAMGV